MTANVGALAYGVHTARRLRPRLEPGAGSSHSQRSCTCDLGGSRRSPHPAHHGTPRSSKCMGARLRGGMTALARSLMCVPLFTLVPPSIAYLPGFRFLHRLEGTQQAGQFVVLDSNKDAHI